MFGHHLSGGPEVRAPLSQLRAKYGREVMRGGVGVGGIGRSRPPQTHIPPALRMPRAGNSQEHEQVCPL